MPTALPRSALTWARPPRRPPTPSGSSRSPGSSRPLPERRQLAAAAFGGGCSRGGRDSRSVSPDGLDDLLALAVRDPPPHVVGGQRQADRADPSGEEAEDHLHILARRGRT